MIRDEDEVQRAHDVLIAVILREIPSPFGDEERGLLMAAANALCWVLRHDHNTDFATNLKDIEDHIASLGGTLRRIVN